MAWLGWRSPQADNARPAPLLCNTRDCRSACGAPHSAYEISPTTEGSSAYVEFHKSHRSQRQIRSRSARLTRVRAQSRPAPHAHAARARDGRRTLRPRALKRALPRARQNDETGAEGDATSLARRGRATRGRTRKESATGPKSVGPSQTAESPEAQQYCYSKLQLDRARAREAAQWCTLWDREL